VRALTGGREKGWLVMAHGSVIVMGILHIACAPHTTPREAVADLTTDMLAGQRVVPTGETQVRPERVQPLGQDRLRLTVLQATLREP